MSGLAPATVVLIVASIFACGPQAAIHAATDIGHVTAIV